MKTRRQISILSVSLALSLSPAWGGSPPNSTPSDLNGNTAGGSNTLYNNNGGYNTGFGLSALFRNTTGSHNVATGVYALFSNATGKQNTATGFNTLFSNTTGFYNTSIGAAGLYYNTTGSRNIATGFNALYYNTTGASNIATGASALFNSVTGNNNLALGESAGFNLRTGSNNIYLANPGGGANEDGAIRIGAAQTRAFIAGVRGTTTSLSNGAMVLIDGAGQLGTINSSARYKENIRNMNGASKRIYDLRPVTFQYKQATEDGKKPLEYGLIAEEVQKVYPDLVIYNKEGQIETVQYHKLTPMLLNELQVLHKQNALQDDRLRVQAEEIASLKQQMAAVETHAQHLETLATRLLRREAQLTTTPVADAR